MVRTPTHRGGEGRGEGGEGGEGRGRGRDGRRGSRGGEGRRVGGEEGEGRSREGRAEQLSVSQIVWVGSWLRFEPGSGVTVGACYLFLVLVFRYHV